MESLNTKKRPRKIEDMTKEQIRQAIKKKQDSNARAQVIVENLLERNITETYLLQSLPDINQSHFEDIIEERSITRLCGYPLCDKPISENDIPKQKYRISLRTNKVYDITGRKSFCSNRCYNAATYVKKQMLTSPLWCREYEVIPVFQLLATDSTGCMGQEVDVSIIEKVETVEQPSFTSIHDFAKASLNKIAPDDESNKDTDSQSNTESAGEENKENPIPNMKPAKETSKAEEVKRKSTPNPSSLIGDIIEKPEREMDPILINTPEREPIVAKKVQPKKQTSISAITIEVEKCLAEWFTLDTMMYLLGEEKVREMVTDKGDCIKEYMNKSIFHSSNNYDQYLVLCRKLNLLDLEERKFDSKVAQRETKPLPDYSMLQEESKRMQLKVKAYIEGKTDIPEPSSTTVNVHNEDSDLTKLPLIDKNAQNAFRRRIVCTHLNKVLPDLLRSLGVTALSLTTDVQYLVKTFKLNADNIMFKPIQWTLISIIMLKLLSLRDPRLQYMLEKPTAFQHMQLLLLSYKQDGGYVDRLISWLTDLDRILDTDDTQMTIES